MTRFHVEIAPGCHGKAFAPVVSEHRTLRAALEMARKSDRLVAVDTETDERWQIPQQGVSRVGRGISPSEARAIGWPL